MELLKSKYIIGTQNTSYVFYRFSSGKFSHNKNTQSFLYDNAFKTRGKI